MINFYPHQKKELDETQTLNKVAYYHDMGLGKTFVGAEKMNQLNKNVNLVICQKAKIEDWINHFKEFYPTAFVFDLTNEKEMSSFLSDVDLGFNIGVINYDIVFRRPELTKLKDFTLMLDESSLIQNRTAKRSKFILKKLKPDNIILLSGTPTGGKYERLWSQLHLLGWDITEDLFWNQFVKFHYYENDYGFPIKIIDGYKNVERLKKKMAEYGCRFLKTNEVFDLPTQNFQNIFITPIKKYLDFKKNNIVTIDNQEFVGDTIFSKILYERMICGAYTSEKISKLKELLESTEDRVIVFYNFDCELRAIEDVCLSLDKPVSIVNGHTKDLVMYNEYSDSVTLIQYQSGSMGINLQKANKIIYFSPTLSSELYEQSKKRIHRIGQTEPCFYYKLIVSNSIECGIYNALEMRKNYTDELFIKEMK